MGEATSNNNIFTKSTVCVRFGQFSYFSTNANIRAYYQSSENVTVLH